MLDVIKSIKAENLKGETVLVSFPALVSANSYKIVYHKLQRSKSYLLYGITGSWSGNATTAPLFRIKNVGPGTLSSDSGVKGSTSEISSYTSISELSPGKINPNNTYILAEERYFNELYAPQGQVAIEFFNPDLSHSTKANVQLSLFVLE